MVEKIPIIDWIDHETGVNAIEKTKNIKKKIVYLDYLMDLEKPTKKYEFLEIGPNDYFNNQISYGNLYQRNDLICLIKPSSDWRYLLTTSKYLFPSSIKIQ